ETRGLQSGIMVAEKPATVQVRMQGRQSVVSPITARDITTFVDLSKGKIGMNIMAVQVVLPTGAQLVSISPSPVTVRLDKITDTQFNVAVDIQGMPASGYLALKPEIQPAQVVVAGPSDVIQRIARVYVEANQENLRASLETSLPVKVKDRFGNNIGNWLEINPSAVQVFIPILEDLPQKTVPVNVTISGKPAQGYRVNRVIVEPGEVSVFGTSKILGTLEAVDTESLDISGAKEDISRQVELILPSGAGSGGLSTVQVVVQITRLGSR
ncbi:MAG: CdaR family protein, partial [Bacillota bacterium]